MTRIPKNASEKEIWFKIIIDKSNNCRGLRKFCYNIYGVTLEKNQYWALRDMLDPKVRLVYYTSARQSGKTHVIALFQAIAAIFPEFVVSQFEGVANSYIFAPKKEQAEISFERFSNFIHFNKFNIYSGSMVNDKFDRMTFQNGFDVRAITASRNSEIEGLTTHIIILDESQAISPYKARECLTGDTMIPLANGTYTTIKKVVEQNLTVLTPKGEQAPIKYYEYGEDEIYEISLANGKKLKCNANHNHLVYHKNWRDNKLGATKKLNTLGLKEGYRLAMISKLPYFGTEGNYYKGILVGSFLGDGCVSGDKPELCGTMEFMNYIDYLLQEEFTGVSTKIKKQRPIKNSNFDSFVEFTCTGPKNTGVFNSNPLTKYFREIGIWGMKGDNKQIPNRAWSTEFLEGVITGLINTDGCVFVSDDTNGLICFDNISENLVKQLQDYLLKFGIHSRISVKENNSDFGYATKPIWTLTIKSVTDILNFYDIFELSPEKQFKLEKLVKQCKSRKGRDKSKYYPNNLRFSRIKSIKKLDKKEKVYCIQVNDPNLWIANGIVTYNSIFPMGGGIPGGAKIIQCGVPGILGSHFHKAFKNAYEPETNPSGYVHHIYPWEDCPRLSKEYVKNLMSDEESFARNYELSWDRNTFGYFITSEQYASCEEDYNIHEMVKMAQEEGWQFFWGVDFAKLRDSTVLTTMVQRPSDGHLFLVGLIELKGTDYTAQIGYFKNIYDPRVVHSCADKTAVGEMPVEAMNEGGIRTTGIHFSTQSKDKIYKNYRYVINNKMIHWPKKLPNKEFKRFKQQMLELEVEYKSTGLISVHHNLDDNLARDDYPDSSCLCVWASTEYVEPTVDFY